MIENLQPPQENTKYEKLSEQVPLDYWFGANYRGAYWSRLGVNKEYMEKICKIMGAPPIKLTSADWKPQKAVVDVEMANVNTAHFKKVGLDEQGPSQAPITSEYFKLLPLAETVDADGIPISIGWNIAINGNAINETIEAKHPFMKSEDKEKLFESMFNKTFWEALRAITTQEISDSRNLTNQGWTERSMLEMNATVISHIIQQLTQHSLPVTAMTRSLFAGGLANLAEKSSENPNFFWRHFFNGGKAASNDWRKEQFPDRYKSEKQGQHEVAHAATRFLPGGYMGEALAFYMYARVEHLFAADKLFKLGSK